MTRHPATRAMIFALALVTLLSLSACSINVKKNAEGEDHNVDIQTPVGGIHVSEDADERDIGLPVYPGAKQKEKDSSGDNKKANVNISGPGFAVRVVAIEYVSPDAPQKLVDYYKEQLKKYGNVLQCQTSEHVGKIDMEHHGDKSDSGELACDKDDNGKTVELKVGVKSNQHIVAIEPAGTGSSFALVYVHTHGKEGTI